MHTLRALIVIAMLFFSSGVIWSLNGDQIMQKNQQLAKPTSSKGSIKLVIKNSGRKQVKEFHIYTKKDNDTTYSRINFYKPGKMQFLIHSKSTGEAEQWIKLSSGRIRRIASANRKSRWAESHFYYEDLKTTDYSAFNFKRLEDGTARSYKKKPIACYRIEATPKESDAVYSKRILFIEKGSFLIRRVLFFERGRHTKTLTNYLYKKISGIMTPRLVYMNPAGSRKNHSYLLLQSMKYNISPSMRHFRRSSF